MQWCIYFIWVVSEATVTGSAIGYVVNLWQVNGLLWVKLPLQTWWLWYKSRILKVEGWPRAGDDIRTWGWPTVAVLLLASLESGSISSWETGCS